MGVLTRRIGGWAIAVAVMVHARGAVAEDLALLLNAANPVDTLTLADVRGYLRLDRRTWPGGARVELVLRASDGEEMAVLLDAVYHVDRDALRRLWVEKLYRGEIALVPSVAPSVAQAGARVRAAMGGLSMAWASEVPDGVKVLAIDGRLPGQPGYSLSAAR